MTFGSMYSQDMNLATKSIFVICFQMSPSDCWKHQHFPGDMMFSDIWIQGCWKHQRFLVDVMFSDIWIRTKHSNGRSSLTRNISLTCCLANSNFLASSAKISAWPRTAQATSSSSERFSANSIVERIFENFEQRKMLEVRSVTTSKQI